MKDDRTRSFLHLGLGVLCKKRTILFILFCALVIYVTAVSYYLSRKISMASSETIVVIHESYQYMTSATEKSTVNSAVVNQNLFMFPINPLYACAPDGQEVRIIVTVCSAAWNFEARQALRSTWFSRRTIQPLNASVVFVLGAVNSSQIQAKILRESRIHHDIIQSDFMDSYRNLSLKTTAMLKWVKKFCPGVQYVLKTDDDTLTNLEKLVAVLDKIHIPRIILGHVIVGAVPYRDNISKWLVTQEEYSETYYPKFCSGSGYVLSRDLIDDLYTATLYTKMFFLEDVFVTGICAQHIRATHLHSVGFKYEKKSITIDCQLAEVVTAHYISPRDLYAYWHALQNLKGQTCADFASVLYIYLPTGIILYVTIVCSICKQAFIWAKKKIGQRLHV
ncbi:beta-1,3-galactosyltransferase 5-like [Liolophura sinensis]|uniref:beta-1,3-galactosyltransferase 5-like n=1 Tax=Liolophura sinensis TaxID=3198878 RepID=UPI0031598BE2